MAAIASDPGAIGSIKTAKQKAIAATPKTYGGTIDNYIAAAGLEPQPVPAPVAAPAAVTPPPPPPPIDFNAMTLTDPEYQRGHAQLVAQNTMNLKTLGDAFQRNRQSSYDNANAHGALFSGAAANAQGSIKDAYDNPVNGQLAQQALDFDRGGSGLYFSVFNRLKQSLANPGAVTDGSR